MIKEINSEKEFELFVKKDKAVVDFYADWCMPCQDMKKIILKMSEKFKNIEFGKVNIDKNQKLAEKFKIDKIPALFFFKKSKLLGKKIGIISEQELEQVIKKL